MLKNIFGGNLDLPIIKKLKKSLFWRPNVHKNIKTMRLFLSKTLYCFYNLAVSAPKKFYKNQLQVSVFRFSAWEYREERGQFYLHQFVKGQPDLNYRNPKVMEEMLDVFRFWLDLGVDGFRMDAVSGLNIFDNWQMIPSRMGQTNSITI